MEGMDYNRFTCKILWGHNGTKNNGNGWREDRKLYFYRRIAAVNVGRT